MTGIQDGFEDGRLRALASAVRLGDGRSTLLFAAYERPGERGPLVRRLRAALPDKNLVEVSLRDRRLDVRDQTSAFFGKLRALADENAGGQDADVVLLTNWDRLLDPAALRDEQATTTLTGLFNRGRASFKTAFPLPVVVLVTHDALAVIEERAPDFVSWKSGVFELVSEEEDETSPPDGGVPGDPWEVFRGAAVLDDEIFGRDTDLDELLKRVLPETFRCGALWGETGTGKSSLLRAGLAPRLERLGHLPVIVDRWEDPAAALRQALDEARVLNAETTSERHEKKRKVVLLCDQFERVFDAIETRDGRALFFEELARPVNDLEFPFCCIFVVRADRLFHLFELDRWVPLHRPLATENLYQLRHLRESDAVRIFEKLRDASGAGWTDELLDQVVQDLADDGRVRPVEIQLIAAGLYLRGVRTIADFAAEGGKEGLRKGYLDGILDELERPELGRHIVRGLVLSASPAIRAFKSLEELVDDFKGRKKAVGATLEELAVRHVVQLIDDGEGGLRWELVHDVLCEPCWRATGPSEMGLSVLRSAMRRGRRWLSLRDYWRALRADFEEVPEVPRKRAQRLLRLTEAVTGVRVLLLALLVLVGVQFSFAHVRIENEEPYAVRVYRGLQAFDWLPAPLGQTVLFDTGITNYDVPTNQRNGLLEISLRVWDGTFSERSRRLHTLVEQDLSARRLCSLGYWEEGTRILVQGNPMSDLLRALDVSSQFEPRLLNLLEADEVPVRVGAISSLSQIELANAEAIARKLVSLLKDNDSDVRIAAVQMLAQLSTSVTVVPELVPLLKDNDSDVRIAAVQTLAQIGTPAAERVVPELVPLLRDNRSYIRIAAVQALGQLGASAAETVMREVGPLLKDKESYARGAAAQVLAQLDAPGDKTVLPELIHKGADALAYLGMSAAKVKMFGLPGLLVKNGSIRIAATQTLGGTFSAKTVAPTLVPLLRDNDLDVRRAAVNALIQLGAPAAETVVPMLIPLLKDNESHARRAAADALIQFGAFAGETVVSELVPLLRDSDSNIRFAAARALGQLGAAAGKTVVSELIPLLKDIDSDVRIAAAQALGQLGTYAGETVVPELIPLFKDNNPNIRFAAAQALSQFSAPAGETVVPELILLLKDIDSDVRSAAAQTLGQLNAFTDETVGLLLKDNSSSVRAIAAKAWVRLESSSSALLLSELQSDESRLDGRYRDSIVRALRFWLQEGQPPPEDGTAAPTAESPLTEKAKQEHDALAAELERLRELERPWWLRIAAWDVLLGPYER